MKYYSVKDVAIVQVCATLGIFASMCLMTENTREVRLQRVRLQRAPSHNEQISLDENH